MRYFEARLEQEQIESTYRTFVSESLRITTKNTSGNDETEVITVKYDDLIQQRFDPEETRTADEIIDYIKMKLSEVGEA